VVDYPEDRLVLTGVRLIERGEYLPYEGLVSLGKDYNVEVIKKLDLDILAARESLSSIEDEGYVVRFENGHMLKLKGSLYLQLHKTLEHIQHEKDLLRLIIDEKLDDAKPFLPEDTVKRLDEFGQKFFHTVRYLAGVMSWNIIEDYDLCNGKKAYAARIRDKDETKIRFQAWDFIEGYDDFSYSFEYDVAKFVYDKFIERIKNNLSTGTKVDSVRHLFGGIRWTP
jgi:RNA ligase